MLDETQLSRLEEELKRAREIIESENRVPLWLISDPRIYELEKVRLWPRVWHFLAHESEVPNPGDYVRRYIGPSTQVIVIRGNDGEVKVFLNACIHKGMALVREDCGSGSSFVCPYHGFTYDVRGRLIGVPLEDIVFGRLDREKLGLLEVRTEVYNGMVFA